MIPVAIRRALGLRTGHTLRLEAAPGGKILLSVQKEESESIEEMLRRVRDWYRRSRQDPVEELHSWRRHERAREVEKRERRRS